MKLFNQFLEETLEEEYNLTLMRGLSYEHLKPEKVMAAIDAMWADWIPRFPDQVVYIDSKFATPREHAANRCISGRDLRIPLDESSIYTVKFRFGHRARPNGPVKELPAKFVQIPLVRPGGYCPIDGSDYYFAPLLVAKGFNVVSHSKIMCWINKLNPNFEKEVHVLTVNALPLTCNYFTCKIYNIPDKVYQQKQRQDDRRINVKVRPAIILYLLVRLGLTETIKRYFDADVIAVDGGYYDVVKQYPTTDYVIVGSTGQKPNGKTVWVRSNLHLVVPKEQWSHYVQHAMAGIFATVDLFGDILTAKTIDDTDTWKYVLGDIILNSPNGKIYLIEQMDNHLNDSIDILFDKITASEFRLDGFDFNCIEDLFVHIIKEGLSILNSHPPHSMEGKRLTVMRYALRSLNGAINQIGYDLTKERMRGNTIDEKKLSFILRALKPNLLISGPKSIREINGEVNTAQSATDNMYFKITSKMVPQDKNDRPTNNKNGGKGVIDKASNRAHASVLKYGRAFSQPSSAPAGREEYNPAVKLTPNGEMYIDDYSQSLVDEVQSYLNLKDNGGLSISGVEVEEDIEVEVFEDEMEIIDEEFIDDLDTDE